MIRPGFLDPEARKDLTELARDGSAAHRLGRRANALVLRDDGMSYAGVAKVLLIDDDTVRTWHRLYEEDGIEGLATFGYEGSACRLSAEQQDKLKAWITETLPRSTRAMGAWIEKECGIEYQGRSGLIALLHRLARLIHTHSRDSETTIVQRIEFLHRSGVTTALSDRREFRNGRSLCSQKPAVLRLSRC